jgi:putative hydrolases of HD superfamily
MDEDTRYADFLFEIGTMRKVLRMHRQTLLTDDMSDNIATHSFRVAMLGWILAKKEGADPYKVVMMCLLHDMGEARSNDHNWVHKRYVTVHEDQIMDEQLGTLPDQELATIAREYEMRETKEAVIAKDADLLDQVLLLREYEWQGNKEAVIWLRGKQGEVSEYNAQLKKLRLESSKSLGAVLCERAPSDWWNELWTSTNRT